MTIGRDSGNESEPVLITEAQPSLDEQLSARRTKYLIMMSIRVVCLVLAAVFYHTPWLLAIFVAGGRAAVDGGADRERPAAEEGAEGRTGSAVTPTRTGRSPRPQATAVSSKVEARSG